MNSRLLFVLLALADLMVGCTTQPTRPPEPTAPRVEQQKLTVPSTGLEVPSLRAGEHPIQKAGYSVLFDKSKRGARWGAYRLNKSTAFTKVVGIYSRPKMLAGPMKPCTTLFQWRT